MAPPRLQIDGRVFRDQHRREVTLRGINCAADAKFPSHPEVPSNVAEHFYEGDTVSFHGRPFSAEDAHTHFERLKRMGYNTIRYIFTWEAVEHAGPGQYDDAWVDHTIQILRIAKEYGFYIFLDPHQDVWSRFTGGSGAPMWTLYAAGLNPRAFQSTQAAIPQNTWPEGPEAYPKMVWATNYYRLACQVMFTAFFGGRDFLPKAIIDGKNIQDYLEEHYFGAMRYLARRIREAGDLENDVVIGWESWNEPNKGLIGREDLSVVPASQPLKNGTSPTPFQAMLLGSGRACEVDTYSVGNFGPYKTGTQLVDPQGETAWLPADHDDTKYGWKRDPGWRLGECIWAQHGIWDPVNDILLKKDYFSRIPNTKTIVDEDLYINKYFVQHWRKFRQAIKSEFSDAIMFCQPSPFEIPPRIKGTEDDTRDMVYAPHFYDGITLMTKKWNRYWSVDVLGILRGKYLSPAFAICIGETAIRNNVKNQLETMRQEGLDNMGEHPCLFSEIGIPFDMDNKAAYQSGDYTSQTLAMDANHYGLEGCGATGYTLWVYTATNNHQWGDRWNGEDLSIFSVDDSPPPVVAAPAHASPPTTSTASTAALVTPPMTPVPSATNPAAAGSRAVEATLRPAPIYTRGQLTSYGFDLRNCTFTLRVDGAASPKPPAEGAAADSATATEIFLPEFHFPRDRTTVEASSGRWAITMDAADNGRGLVQRLCWWHGAGPQSLTVRGVQRRMGSQVGPDEDEGYWEQCRRSTCTVM